ncbi:hypothetical protein AK812_SmicGene42181 [Symbiodinium microadriaticum]|uniref:Uncharacterized protein n=1 Tax=Symbiodinium microadriaticum TaxID=2951 RepID=A0A1Q9C479_SYMMI|nr:hypothetical protein AK812_SmicGene42181 [Symbiodinium microadriaticum]
MGGRKNQYPTWQGNKEGNGPSWQLWHGARSPAQRPWRQAEDKSAPSWKFPSFDSRQVAVPKAAPVDGGPGIPSERHQRLRDLQGMVNGARKAESRLSRATAAKERTQAQWQQFLAEMKASFQKEQRRFFQLMERQEKEVAAAAEGQEQAHAIICQAAYSGELSGTMDVDASTNEQDQEWEQMMQSWEEEGGGAAADVLRRALGGLLRTPDGDVQLRQALGAALQTRTPQRGSGAAPRSPPGLARRPSPVREEAPGSADLYPSPVPTESLSPSVSAAMKQMSMRASPVPAHGGTSKCAHPGQRDPSRPRVPSAVEAPRPNIKDATKAAPKQSLGPALSEKLEARRQELATAALSMPARGRIQDDDQSSDLEEMTGPEPTALAEHIGVVFGLLLVANAVALLVYGGGLSLLGKAQDDVRDSEAGALGPCGGSRIEPDELLPESPADSLFQEQWPLPFRIGSVSRVSLEGWNAVRLLPGAKPLEGEGHTGWLGVHVLCPFYQTEVWAIRCCRDASPDAVLHGIDCLTEASFDIGLGCLVPTWPQRHIGCATVLRYPACLDALCPPRAAIVVDLSCVGGHFYGALLPMHLVTEDIRESVEMFVRGDLDGFDIFVGAGDDRLVPGQRVVLDHGDVITCVPAHAPGPGGFAFEDQFADECEWGPVEHIPQEIRTPSVGVVCGEEFFTLQGCFHGRSSVREACIRASRLAGDFAVGFSSSAFHNLSLRGEPCDRLIALAEVPPRSIGSFQRRDVFVFCDLRPLGLEPRAYFSHSVHIHLPSLASLLGLRAPTGFSLQVSGFLEGGDEVLVHSGTVLVFRALRLSQSLAGVDADSPKHLGNPGTGLSDWEELSPLRPWAGLPSPQSPARSHRSRSSYGSGSSRAFFSLAHKCYVGSSQPFLALSSRYWELHVAFDLEAFFARARGLSAAPLECKQPDGAGLPNNATGRLERPGAQWRAHATLPVARTDPFAPIDVEAYAAALTGVTDEWQTPWVNALFFVLAPGRAPDVLLLPLRTPCTVDEALEAVAECRDEECARHFPSLHYARPQPDRRFAVVLSQPEWDPHPVILVDSSRLNSRVVCASVPDRLDREALLGLLDIPPDAEVDVFVQELLWALAPGQVTELYSGMTVFFCPRGRPRPSCFQLRLMLLDVHGWDSEADLPAPEGEFFLLLTDFRPFVFHVHPARRGMFREDIARALGCEESRLTVRFPNPRVGDACHQGFLLQGVAVATAVIPRLPIPPAYNREQHLILVFDARPVLRSFLWRLCGDRLVPVHALEALFSAGCPDGYQVSFLGVPVVPSPDGDCLSIEHGSLVTVAYVKQGPGIEDEPSTSSEGPSDPVASGGPPPPDESLDDSGLSDSSRSSCSNRSRTPRSPARSGGPGIAQEAWVPGRGLLQPVGAAKEQKDRQGWPFACPVWCCCVPLQWCKCDLGFQHGVPSTGHYPGDTPAPTDAGCGSLLLSWVGGEFFARQCKLLREPGRSHGGRQGPVARLRSFARFAGEPWPYLPEDQALDVDMPGTQVTDEVEEAPPLAVCILILGYSPELIEALVPIGATAETAVQAVREARVDFRSRVFAYISIPGRQPSAQWLLALAFPSWAVHDCFVAFDLLALDGRLFLEATPAVFDKACLLRIARLPEAAEVDVYVGSATVPLAPHVQVQGFTGQSVVVCPAGSRAPSAVNLAQVLSNDIRAAHRLALPAPAGKHLCIVTEDGQRLLSFRSTAEVPSPWVIPVMMGFPAQTRVCVLGPEAAEVSIAGFDCQTVIALVDEGPARISEPMACVVDCTGSCRVGRLNSSESLAFRLQLSVIIWRLLCLRTGVCSWKEPLRRMASSAVMMAMLSGPLSSPSLVSRLSLQNMKQVTARSDRSRSPRRGLDPNVDACAGCASGIRNPRRQAVRTNTVLGNHLGCFNWLFAGIFFRQMELLTAAAVIPSAGVPAEVLRCPNQHERPSFEGRGSAGAALRRRALPTPCRARTPPQRSLPLAFLCSGPTLLEQTAEFVGGTALFESRCLLEVLVEHSATRSAQAGEVFALPEERPLHSPEALAAAGRCLLQLDSLIPDSTVAPPYAPSGQSGGELGGLAQDVTGEAPLRPPAPEVLCLDAGQCALPCDKADFHQATAKVPFHQLGAPPAEFLASGALSDWLRDGCVGRSPSPSESLVLTADGSYYPTTGQVGWAVVLSLVDSSGRFPGQLIGCLFGNAAEFLDATPPDAYMAEVVALWWAAAAALQLAVAVPVIFRADNQAALWGCAGSYGMPVLLVRLDVGSLRLMVFVGHAPHRGHTVEDRLKWWRTTSTLCSGAADEREWVFLLDGNCRVGSETSVCIGDCHADPQDEPGAAMHQLFERSHVWAPSTFTECMVGPGGTLVQKQSRSLQRCDYVAIPQAWRHWRVVAQVNARISAGHQVPDHFALQVLCEVSLQTSRARHKARRIDPAALAEPSNQERIERILSSAPGIDWNVSVHDHAALLAEYLYCQLADAFPLQKRRLRKSFLSEEAGRLHADLAGLRHALRYRLETLRLTRLRCVWAVWTKAHDCFDVLFSGRWLKQLKWVIAFLIEQVGQLGRDLRRMCRRDKRTHVDSLADMVQDANAGEVHVAVKRLLRPKKFRRQGMLPLPRLRKQDGSFCVSHQEVTSEWRRHFADLEGGAATTPDELLSGCLESQQHCHGPETLDWNMVPDLWSVPAAILFVDISSAYYAVVRELIVGGNLSTASLADLAASLSLTSDDLQVLQGHIRAEPVLSGESGGEVLRALTQELHRQTWFLMHDDDTLVQTRRGTRPGSSIADVLYSLLFTKVLQRRPAFGEECVPTLIPWSGHRQVQPFDGRRSSAQQVSAQDLIYADDLATCLLAKSSQALPTVVQREEDVFLSFVTMAQARQCFREGKRDIFCSPRIALARRVILFKTHVLSSLLAGAGAWPSLCSGGWHALDAGLHTMTRQMLRIPHSEEQNWSKERIAAVLGILPLPGLLAIERIRFLGQLFRSGPDAAFALLQHAPSAQRAFLDAGVWFCEAVQHTGGPGPIDTCWEQWGALFGQVGRFRGLLKRAEAWHLDKLRCEAALQTFARRSFAPVPKPVVSLEEARHACLQCRVAFYNFHAWSGHAARVHGYRSRARRFASGTRCQACGTFLHTLPRYRRHLQTSTRCCQAIELGVPGLFPVFEDGSGHPQSVAHGGVGTDHLPPAGEPVAFALLERLRSEVPCTDEAVFQLVTSFIEPLPLLRSTLEVWISELSDTVLQAAASDALLCLQPDLWCTKVSHAPSQVQADADFVPLLVPLPAVCAERSASLLIGEHDACRPFSRVLPWDSDVPSPVGRASM